MALGTQFMDEAADASAAIANFDKALSLVDDYAPALINKGKTLALTGDMDLAEQYLRRASDTDEKSADALVALADVYLAQRAQAEALDCLLGAVERQPKEARIHEMLAELYNDLGMPHESAVHASCAARLRKKRKK